MSSSRIYKSNQISGDRSSHPGVSVGKGKKALPSPLDLSLNLHLCAAEGGHVAYECETESSTNARRFFYLKKGQQTPRVTQGTRELSVLQSHGNGKAYRLGKKIMLNQ